MRISSFLCTTSISNQDRIVIAAKLNLYKCKQFRIVIFNFGVLFQCANGSGFFELQVLEMANPRSELSSGECCGGVVRSPVTGRCSTQCNTFFRLCLKEYQSNVTSTGSCSFGNTSSPVLGRDTFTLADPDRGKLVLPFTFRWTVCRIFLYLSPLLSVVAHKRHQSTTNSSSNC